MSKKLYIKVPTNVVRNEDVTINNGEFMLYARLCFLYFRNYGNEELKIDHKKLMHNLYINDSRTLKKRFNKLYKCGLILNDISNLPKRGDVTIVFNKEWLDKCEHFTMLNANVFNKLENIDEHAFRLVFYYKSHINLKEKKDFCYVGFETLKVRLKMGNDTIKSANDQLVKSKLVKIVKHKLQPTGEFDFDDELVYERYNNHYYVDKELF